MKSKAGKKNEPVLLTLDQVATSLEVTTRQVQRYMADDDDPIVAAVSGSGPNPDLFDNADLMKWYARREMRGLQMDDNGKFYSLEEERARLTHHQANKVSLEERQLDGQLLPVDEVRRAWCKITSEIRSRLLALPTRLAQVAIAASTLHEIEDACTDEIHSVLGDLSKVEYDESDISPDGGSARAHDPTTKADSRAMG